MPDLPLASCHFERSEADARNLKVRSKLNLFILNLIYILHFQIILQFFLYIV